MERCSQLLVKVENLQVNKTQTPFTFCGKGWGCGLLVIVEDFYKSNKLINGKYFQPFELI
jgi:hypothetical protein